MRIVRESDSYEEFLVRAHADEETSDFLAHWVRLSRWFNAAVASIPAL